MCKSCQYCWESCYWNLIEKHFCFDEEIALYNDPSEKEEKNNNLYDNLAFYDKVAIIAGRSIVTIDPLSSKSTPSTPIISQPPRRVRWWEDDVDEQNRKNEEKYIRHAQSNEELTSGIVKDKRPADVPSNILEEKEKSKSSGDVSVIEEKSSLQSELPIMSRLKIPGENLASASSNSSSRSSLDEKPKIRKKSLRERRMSRSLTLDIERALELPVIKQQFMPKFYAESPDASKLDISGAPTSVLVSPRIRKESKAYEYDLRSVVQIENEKKKTKIKHAPIHKQMSQSKLLSIKDKFIRPQDKFKHQFSTGSLPNSSIEKKCSEKESHLTHLLH